MGPALVETSGLKADQRPAWRRHLSDWLRRDV